MKFVCGNLWIAPYLIKPKVLDDSLELNICSRIAPIFKNILEFGT